MLYCSSIKKYLLYEVKWFTLIVVLIRGKWMKAVKIYQLFSRHVLWMFLFLLLVMSCGDTVIDTSKSTSNSNKEFKLTLTISDDIVRLNSSIKLTATVERKVHKDSISNYVSMKMMMDAVGGSIDGHSFTSPSSITVAMDSDQGATFEALAFFNPSSSYSTSQGYYNYKENGHVSASFDGINVSMPIKMVVPR